MRGSFSTRCWAVVPFLCAFIEQTHGELSRDCVRSRKLADSSHDSMARSGDSLVDKLVGRTFQVLPSQHADIDYATHAKPGSFPAISEAAPSRTVRLRTNLPAALKATPSRESHLAARLSARDSLSQPKLLSLSRYSGSSQVSPGIAQFFADPLHQTSHQGRQSVAGRSISSSAASTTSWKWVLFFHESMRTTAEKVQKLMPGQVVLSELDWNRFNDGFPNLQVNLEDAQKLESYYGTCFLVSFHNPEVIFEQLSLLYALPRQFRAKNLRIILPWFSTGTMERVEQIGQVVTAATLARMISATPVGPSGPNTVVIFDIHALQEQFYFLDNILVELKSAVWLLKAELHRLRKENPGEEIAVAFPDDGAYKRFKSKFEGFPLIICEKRREGDERIVRVKEGNATGRHVVIVDDLVQSGGTLLECAKPLKVQGATKVSCFVTHGVFPQDSFQKFMGNDLIHKFWLTDSIPTTAQKVDGQGPFEVLSIAPLVVRYLRGVAEEN